MGYFQLVFSPTGGTERAARAVTSVWGSDVSSIDLSDPGFSGLTLQAEDLALIALPVFGGRLPALAGQRLSQVQGNGARCALLCVYGNRDYDDALVELEDLAKECGFQVVAAMTAIAEHSIVRQVATSRPDPQDLQQLEAFSRQILEKFRSGDKNLPTLPGNRPYKKGGSAGLIPKPDSSCTGCGLCARQCPAGAISPEDVHRVDPALCFSCMRCISVCPTSARKIGGPKVSLLNVALKKMCASRRECELFI